MQAGTPVGRGIVIVQAQVTFAGNRHAKRSMGKDFNLDRFPGRAADVLFVDLADDFRYLVQAQFAGGHHHVGKLGVELHGFEIADVALGGDMDFDPYFPGVSDDRPVG